MGELEDSLSKSAWIGNAGRSYCIDTYVRGTEASGGHWVNVSSADVASAGKLVFKKC
jgi:hypothetical protein